MVAWAEKSGLGGRVVSTRAGVGLGKDRKKEGQQEGKGAGA